MKERAGEATYDFHTFQSMGFEHQRVLNALAAGTGRFLAGVPVQVEVEFREVDEAPSQDYWFPEPSLSPEEFDRLVREAGREFLAQARIVPETVHEHTRRLMELVRTYQEVRFRKGVAAVGGAFRPGLITVYLLRAQTGGELTDHVIATLAHETYHAACFRTADRRRAALRQHLNYQDDRGFQVWEEVMACLFAREVCRLGGCPGEGDGEGVTREFLGLGEAVLARLGLDFAGLNRQWLMTSPAAEAFWDAQGDALFRSLHGGGWPSRGAERG
ncbi:MAG TPA: hypothetical protein GXX28_06035 [Firmicutes bacterium]|nr:hypothetical protein [Bacillota bacterium]